MLIGALAMASSGSIVATSADAASMVAALRRMTWGARAAVLACLRDVDLPLWVRCVADLGPDEVSFSAMTVLTVEDFDRPIPLLDALSRPVRLHLRRKTRVLF